MKRREFVKAGAALGALPAWKAQVPAARPADRLDHGPFTIDQDEGWYTIEAATPAPGPVRNFGVGDPAVAERTFVEMTRFQMETWKKTPLVVNTQPDISHVGNDAVRELAMRGGCWLRSE